MTASELAQYALAAKCTFNLNASTFEHYFQCPIDVPCSSCKMWNIPNLTKKCLFWDKDLVSHSLEIEAANILKTTHPEFFI